MDNRERTERLAVAFRVARDDWQSSMWTALPAIVEEYRAPQLVVDCVPAVKMQIKTPTGLWRNTTITLLINCPVMFQGGGGFLSTFPLVKGDEGLVVFSCRCIDAWWQQGGVQPQAELRMHDLSDGFFIPATMSQPNIPTDASTTTMRVRNKANTLAYELDPTTMRFNVTAPGGLWVNGVMVTVP